MTCWQDYATPLIKRWEGCKLTAYQDIVGVWTIGYGSTGFGVREGTVWTQEKADSELIRRLNCEFGPGVEAAIKRPATPQQMAAMVSLAYNIGVRAFTDSTLVRLFNLGNVTGAESQFARWNKAGGKVVQGLVNRRAAEAALFASRA